MRDTVRFSPFRIFTRRAVIALGISAALSCVAIAGNSRSVRFQHVTRDDGLSQSFVYSIVQDQQGFLWFGTQEGLNRYDGFEFTVFAHNPDDPGSISDESIRTIFMDRSGTLWIGTDAGGLSQYDQALETFTNYLHDPEDPASIGSNRVRTIYEDSAGHLWIGTDGAGLDRFDRETETFQHFGHDPSEADSLSGAHVWSILESSDGVLWIGTDGGLSKFDTGTGLFTHFRHEPDEPSTISDNRVRVLYEDSDRTLWIGTESGGLNRFVRDDESFEKIRHDPDNSSSISADRINTIYQDDAGVLWVGTVKGLNAWNPVGQTFERYTHDANDRYSLSHDNVLSIFQDRSNVLWVGTYDGLSRWNQATRAMLHFKHDADDPNSLTANTVTSFAEDASGILWVGTFGGGLNALDRESGTFAQIRHRPERMTSLSSDQVMALHVDRDDVLWAGTRDAGLNRYDRENGRFTRFQHAPDDPTSLGADGVTYILEDSVGDGLWVATFGGGLNYFDRDSKRFTRYLHQADDPASLSSDRVLVLYEDAQKKLWIGTYGGGLNRFDRKTQSFTRFMAEPERPDGLSGNEIFMIREDEAGDLWIGVKGGGLNRWRRSDRENGRLVFERFSELDGLPSATIYSGAWDETGKLWMSTSRGLSRLDIESLEFQNYDISHGLQGAEFNLAAGFRSSDGQLFFGGLNGFNAFRPDQLVRNPRPPQVAITRFLSINKPVDLGEARSSGAPVELDYRQNVTTFEFVALDYAAPENNRFIYRLDGLDDNWIDAGTLRQVTYTNLPAGRYTFRVKAANNEGTWSDREASLNLRMQPAPWQTWWAYSGYLLVLAALVAFALRAHSRRAQRTAMLEHAKELSVIQRRLTEAQRMARIGNWEWSVAGNELWWSDETYRLFQVDKSTARLSYDFFLQHVHPDDRKTVNEAVELAVSRREPYSIEYRIVRPDGSRRVVHEQAEARFDENGQPIKLAGTVHDITERKQAENDMRHHAEFQELLAQLSSDLVRGRPERIDQQLRSGLQEIGNRYELDAVSIWWLTDDRLTMRSFHRWCRSVDVKRDEHFDQTQLPWTTEQLSSGRPVVIDDLSSLPAEASTDKKALEQLEAKSLLIVPVLVDETLLGACVFSTYGDARAWTPRTVTELTLVAQNVGGAVARSKAVVKIQALKDRLEEENYYLRDAVQSAHNFDEIIGEDAGLKECLKMVEKVAPTDVSVLILGETGTGKELLARAIHRLSSRRDGPMVSVNCPALPTTLIESELFGHEKGAYTGAHSTRRGRFELAEGGTLFLDEIGELPLDVQSKLLRVLQTGEYDRLGSTKTRHADVRLIAATNRDLRRAVEDGEFRADLFYRISSFPISLPALRQRKSDIPVLAEHFVRKHAGRLNKTINAISARMIEDLVNYAWPGNIRELESIIERALISAEDNSVLTLPGPLRLIGNMHQSKGDFVPEDSPDLSTIERAHIVSVLNKTGWKISGADGAASMLGVPPSTLRSKMKRLGVTRQNS